MKVIAETGRAH